MPSTLVETKLYIPQPRDGTVPRPRLSDLLAQHPGAKLTLLSAPAGFGKSTLLASWLHDRAVASPESAPATAWVSLDAGDSDPVRFWTYVTTAVHRATGGPGENALAVLTSGRPSVDGALAILINELASLDHDLDLVLDDYHLVDGPRLLDDVTFLLDHLPARVHLIVSSRVDPTLPLPRLRARGQLVEIRASDLRFSQEEATTYLNQMQGLDLSHIDVTALGDRTEGWAAALQLAALSLQGRPDRSDFIAGFTGDDRYIVDYLVEEVLDQQPAAVRSFLLRTSILDRLNGDLCDTVTGSSDGKQVLEHLDRANLFLVRLDDTRRWYRYHHLFADLLQARLRDEQPDLIPTLHERACDWYETAGEPVPAVCHALASGDPARAATLVELAIPELRRTRQEDVISGWANLIPDEILTNRPVLAVGLISGLMSSGQFTQAEQRIADVAPHMPAPGEETASPASGIIVADHTEWARLPGELTMYRAALALIRGDPGSATQLADAAMSQAGTHDDLTHAGAAAIAGLASWGLGDLEAAHRAYTACVERLQHAGHIADVLGCCLTLADIRTTQGHLSNAERTYTDALELARAQPGPVLRGTADMHVGISQVAWQRNDLVAAAHHLQLSDDLGERSGLPQHPWRSRVARARLHHSEGRLEDARALLDEAERVYVSDFLPEVQPIAALRARLDLARGDLASAWTWLRTLDLSPADDLTYLRELEHITLARVLLTQHRTHRTVGAWQDATRLLDRLQKATEEGERTGNLLEVLVLQSQAHQDRDQARAQTILGRALRLAEPEGHLRVFLDEAPALTPLLRAIVHSDPTAAHARAVLDASTRPAAQPEHATQQGAPNGRDHRAGVEHDELREPLSQRELDVLRLLATDLDGPAIARELSVSLSTVRTHTQHIYTKLGASNRRAAVRAAHELGLLRSTPSH